MLADEDTLAGFRQRPMVRPIDLSNVPVPAIVTKLNAYMLGDKPVKPEVDALKFYMANHAVAEIMQCYDPHEPLPEDKQAVLKLYLQMLRPSALRMIYYLLLITTRESRHAKWYGNKATEAKTKNMTAFQYVNALPSGSSEAAAKIRNAPPQLSIGQYVEFIEWVFFNAGFSGGFGGKPWGEVAKCLRRFVTGETSAELMMDTAFTLCHNNGPIFNKGMLYQSYSMGWITEILDVQRSGQIPNYVAENSGSNKVPKDVQSQFHQLFPRMGWSYEMYVDWYQVEALGSVNKYPNQKHQQVAKHGQPDKVAPKPIPPKQDSADYLEIMPGVKVKKIPRKKAA